MPVTFDDFARYGIRRHSIGPALDELEALGFIEITEHGKMARAAEYRRPNKFLLMSRPKQKGVEATADGGGSRQRRRRRPRSRQRGRWRAKPEVRSAEKKKPPVPKRHRSPVPKRHCKSKIASAETAPLCAVPKRHHYLYLGEGTEERYAPTPPPPPRRRRIISAPAEPAAAPPANGVRMIEGIYRITGRAEPIIVFAAPHPTLPLEKPTDRAAHAVAA